MICTLVGLKTLISKAHDTTFLGKYVDYTVLENSYWTITHKLIAASYVMRSVKPKTSHKTLKVVY